MHIMVKPRVHSAESTRALASSRRKHVQEAALEAAEEADRIAEHRKKYLERYLRAQGISTSAEDKEARDPIMSIDFLSRLSRAEERDSAAESQAHDAEGAPGARLRMAMPEIKEQTKAASFNESRARARVEGDGRKSVSFSVRRRELRWSNDLVQQRYDAGGDNGAQAAGEKISKGAASEGQHRGAGDGGAGFMKLRRTIGSLTTWKRQTKEKSEPNTDVGSAGAKGEMGAGAGQSNLSVLAQDPYEVHAAPASSSAIPDMPSSESFSNAKSDEKSNEKPIGAVVDNDNEEEAGDGSAQGSLRKRRKRRSSSTRGSRDFHQAGAPIRSDLSMGSILSAEQVETAHSFPNDRRRSYSYERHSSHSFDDRYRMRHGQGASRTRNLAHVSTRRSHGDSRTKRANGPGQSDAQTREMVPRRRRRGSSATASVQTAEPYGFLSRVQASDIEALAAGLALDDVESWVSPRRRDSRML